LRLRDSAGLDSGRGIAGTRLWVAQLVAFSALGWLVAEILDAIGVLRLADAFFVSGLLLAVIAGLVALEGSDLPVNMRLRTASTFSTAGLADRVGLGVPLSRAQALAVVGAGVAAAGLIAVAHRGRVVAARLRERAFARAGRVVLNLLAEANHRWEPESRVGRFVPAVVSHVQVRGT
jgi:hypothetical protein